MLCQDARVVEGLPRSVAEPWVVVGAGPWTGPWIVARERGLSAAFSAQLRGVLRIWPWTRFAAVCDTQTPSIDNGPRRRVIVHSTEHRGPCEACEQAGIE